MPDKLAVTKKPPAELDAERVVRWKKQIADDADHLKNQRQKANEDLRFIYADGGMWEEFLEEVFTEDRVKLQLDITTPYKNRFIGEYNNNRIGVDYQPDEEAATEKDGKLLSGIRNKDFRDHFGKMAQDNCVDEVATCGYGCYKLATKFEDEEDLENDNQRVIFHTIYEAYNTVIWDRTSRLINKADARRVHELVEFTLETFEENWPGKVATSAYVPEDLRDLNEDGGVGDNVFIANRYEIVRRKVPAFIYMNLQTEEIEVYFKEDHEKAKDELARDEKRRFIRERMMIRQHVEKTVFSGTEILEKTRRIPGKWIPIIPMYGFRGFVDGQEWYKGLVRGLKDAQRLFNVQISQLVENAATGNQSLPIFDPMQMIGDVAATWEDLNNKAYALAHSLKDSEGKIVHFGPLGYTKPAELDQATAALMQIVPQYIQQVTGGAPQDTLDPNISGKAIQALLKRENRDTQDMMDNISNAVEWEGTVYQAIAADIYNTPRLMRTLGNDGVEGSTRIFELIFDDESGMVIEANTVGGKKFKAYSEIGPQYDSEREQMVEELKGMADVVKETEVAGKYMPAIIALLMENITGPGTDAIKKLVRQDLIIMGLVDPETDEEKQFLAQAQQSQQEKDPQAQLAESLAEQALSEGRERDSKAQVNVADAIKKTAETQKILEEIEGAKVSNLLEIRRQILGGIQGLPLKK